jgi:hypothetical protein
MTIRFRTIFLILIALTLLLALSPLILGLASTAFTYTGKCYGFTDGVRDCTWQEYATDQIFWSASLAISPGLILVANWLTALGFWLYKRRISTSDGLPLSQVILIPVIACLGGVCLISALPVVINLFDKLIR